MKYTLIIIAILLTNNCFSQQSLIAMSVETTFNDTTAEGLPVVLPTTVFTTSMTVSVDQGDNIYKLHIKLGSTEGGSEYLATNFDYNTPGIFGSTSYAQIGNNITLVLGSFTGMVHYYAEVQVERNDHTMQTPFTFSR
jgi:hypothetical protein